MRSFFIFLAALGLRCCARAFSSCGEPGLLFIAVHGLLNVVSSLVAEHGLQRVRASVDAACVLSSCSTWLSSCGTQAQLLHGMWYLPRPGLEPASPVLAGRFLTTTPPGKPRGAFLYESILYGKHQARHFIHIISFNSIMTLRCWYYFYFLDE